MFFGKYFIFIENFHPNYAEIMSPSWFLLYRPLNSEGGHSFLIFFYQRFTYKTCNDFAVAFLSLVLTESVLLFEQIPT